jgi:5-methylcytosine-specific restriction enzyme A
MPYAPPRHCPRGHPAFTGSRCPICASAAKAAADKRKPSASARGYDAQWRNARDQFLREHPTCASCGWPSIVVDHIAPHKGDQSLFWNRRNWQALCKPCHDRKTAQRDGAFGRPTRCEPTV